MRTHGRLLLAAVAAVAGLGATASTAAAKQVKLTIADDGAHVRVAKGDTIAITLAANQTTPFHWVAYDKPNPKVARLTGARYVQGGSGMPGAGGTQRYTIKATGKGATAFATQYQEISTGAPGRGRSDFVITITVTK
jgi:predicted secreted protein